MTLAGSLQLSHDLGLHKNQGCNKQFKSVIRTRNVHLLRSTLSSSISFQQQDTLCLHLSRSVYRPIHAVPYRYNAFRCHSFMASGGAFDFPIVKTATTVLTRSYKSLQACPFIVKLVPAVGIVIFALWGLSPVMRQIRNILLHKSDSSWKKSSTYHVATSYLQPLLLWTGAILICRTFDPIILPSEASELVKQRLLNFVRSLSTVLAAAYCLSSVIQQAQKFFMETSDSKDARNMGFQFAGKAVYSAVWVAAVSLFMELLGFSTQKWLTAGGLGTVLLTLAGREIFTNFLSSAIIHATRPFVMNEWIQTKIEGYDVSGTVEHVGWWSPTIVRGEDREAVHIPNHKFTVNVVRNISQKTHWRIKTHLAISHLDVNKINIIVADMRKVLAKNPQVEQQRLHRRVFLENINPENQALLILISCFVKTSHHEEYLCVKEAILLDLLRVISHHRARLATPIRTVQKIYGDADLENIPFSDSVYSRGGVAHNRPLLLIEPHYKVNGEDKTKAQSRSARTTGEQESKATARQSPDTKLDNKAEVTPVLNSKADAKSREMSNSGIEDPKVGAPLASNPKVAEKGTMKSTSKSAPKTNSKIADLSNSASKASGSVLDNATQRIPEALHSKRASVDDANQSVKSKNPPLSSSEVGADIEGGLSTSQSKQGSERSPAARPPLEDNIVLGVALEGSKRTLPIEEGMTFPSTSPDQKELAARGSGNSSTASEKDKKDNQTSATRSPTSGDK